MTAPLGRNVLVTGAQGFLGRYVAQRFASAGFAVTGIGHGEWAASDYSASGLASWHQADITLETLLDVAGEPDCIVHCAGSGSVGFSLAHPYDDFARTALTTAAVLEYARHARPNATIVLPSSAAVYGSATTLPNLESSALLPTSPYGVHKVIAESLCQSYAAHYKMRVAIVRLFSLYGEGLRKQLMWDACRKLTCGVGDFSGSGEELRDWLHVEDAAELLLKAASNASSMCPVVNGGSGRGISVRDALSILSRSYGKFVALAFSGEKRPGDPIGYEASISAARSWGWEPRITLDHGVQRYVDWFKGVTE